MTSLKPILAVAALVLVSACGTPEEQCRRAATQELRTLDGLIAGTEANLARGYAIETETDLRPRLSFCYGRSGDRLAWTFCRDADVVRRQGPVAIDPAAQRRKLDTLRSRRAAAERTAERALAACG